MPIHLRGLSLLPIPHKNRSEFPFSLPILQSLENFEFSQPVTFFVGENGTGKSTLIEAIACAAESVTVGSSPASHDETLDEARKLASYLKLVWNQRTRKGFFLRAEDFFGFARQVNQSRAALQKDLQDLEQRMTGHSDLAQQLARVPFQRELSGYHQYYGAGLDQVSHGESFLALFQARFVPGGLYLLDEPETPLSPLRQLALISALKQMVDQNAQFIIATHSPILMAFPGAEIISFDHQKLERVEYESLEHVRLTRDFLNDPDSFLRHL